MTARRTIDERDPLPERPWAETSSTRVREDAKRRTAEAIKSGKDARTRPVGEVAE